MNWEHRLHSEEEHDLMAKIGVGTIYLYLHPAELQGQGHHSQRLVHKGELRRFGEEK
jgi:hypothetical protein